MSLTRFEQTMSHGLHSAGIETIQVNVGLRCNQQCRHCHLGCSPARTEGMEWPVIEMVLAARRTLGAKLVDITGGAPEMNGNLRRFVDAIRSDRCEVQVRTNLTILLEPGMGDMIEFFRNHRVRLVASMPCYLEENVTAQRGPGVYSRSVEAIRRLNAVGYGVERGLQLNLVYNPVGPFLPHDQSELERDYRRELGQQFGISFTKLLTIANMPIGRFGRELKQRGQDREYMNLLERSFNPDTIDGLMCRHQISVGWDGTLYDCDFNLALGYAVNHGAPDHLSRLDPDALATRRIVTGEHCFGCTAGRGSSCGGALV